MTVPPRATASWTAIVPNPARRAVHQHGVSCADGDRSRTRADVPARTGGRRDRPPAPSEQGNAADRGLHRAAGFAEECDRTLQLLLDLVRRAKEAGTLRRDFVLEGVSLALMANEGIRGVARGTGCGLTALRCPDAPVVPGGPCLGAASTGRPTAALRTLDGLSGRKRPPPHRWRPPRRLPEGRRALRAQAPTVPSTPSRRKSACPLWRPYSKSTCTITMRSDTSWPHLG